MKRLRMLLLQSQNGTDWPSRLSEISIEEHGTCDKIMDPPVKGSSPIVAAQFKRPEFMKLLFSAGEVLRVMPNRGRSRLFIFASKSAAMVGDIEKWAGIKHVSWLMDLEDFLTAATVFLRQTVPAVRISVYPQEIMTFEADGPRAYVGSLLTTSRLV